MIVVYGHLSLPLAIEHTGMGIGPPSIGHSRQNSFGVGEALNLWDISQETISGTFFRDIFVNIFSRSDFHM